MEVDKRSFRRQLLPILRHISNASYVTFDLEMSGISTRPRYSPGDRSHDIGKPSLQQQFDEVRDAAQQFQVLQVGITCVEEDREREYYLARPYNFPLSPLSADGIDLKLERKFSFSSSACDFLQKNSFDFGKVFTRGITYLSQEEEHDLKEEYQKRADKNSKIPELIIPPHEVATLEFYRSARKKIAEWADSSKPGLPFVNIGQEQGALNGYQRRLIYQLVRAEFPELRTFARNDGHFMQIEKLDLKKEAEFQKKNLDKFDSQISKQKGLRWIFEALSGGDLSGINPAWFCDETSEGWDKQLAAKKLELDEIIHLLKSKQHVLVGHNLFTDLAFLYNTFFGTLARNVKHFQEDIHELFPIVIDTKYLATHGTGSMNPRSNLRELLQPFKAIHVPLVVLHENHTNYGSTQGKDHEAGFDSWMTAELFIKLGHSLFTGGKQLRQNDNGYSDGEAAADTLDEDVSSEDSGGAPLAAGTSDSSDTMVDNFAPAWHAKQLNPFAVLSELSETLPTTKRKQKIKQWLPKIDHKFWDLYANKLRVNASEGGVCDLEEAEGPN